MKIISVVGARPNFMKIAPFIHEINNYNKTTANPIQHILVHTGQHYDDRMSQTFFEQLNIPTADINLGVGSGSHAEQVGHTMIAFEKILKKEKPDWVVVVGDVNATLACSVTAKKEWIKVCHIEAGLRSGDITMPEEVNRLVTDRLSDLLLTPDYLSNENLKKEGVTDDRMVFVGNIMIDTLEANRHRAEKISIKEVLQNNYFDNSQKNTLNIENEHYALITLHRPSNVDEKEVLEPIIRFLIDEVAVNQPILWPIHPRTQKQLVQFGLFDEVQSHPNIILLQPLGYFDMLRLNMGAKIMLTDSGGLQEECTILGTPCLTLRWNTERPVTLKEHGGASVLVGNNVNRIREEYNEALQKQRAPIRPPLWDGQTAGRCLQAILNYNQ
jgi:UDP-N-acetylglucosamine 2-epimerase (non-hydrolysing)